MKSQTPTRSTDSVGRQFAHVTKDEIEGAVSRHCESADLTASITGAGGEGTPGVAMAFSLLRKTGLAVGLAPPSIDRGERGCQGITQFATRLHDDGVCWIRSVSTPEAQLKPSDRWHQA